MGLIAKSDAAETNGAAEHRGAHPSRKEVAGWLRTLLSTDEGKAELRAIGVTRAGSAATHVESSFYGVDPEAMARDALALSGRASGVYFTLNPVRDDHPGGAAKDDDILRRRWLLVDIDPTRPGVVSSTDTEKAEASAIARATRDYLRRRGWPDPVLADSGNGWHLLYRLDLPNDDAARDLVRRCLRALDAIMGTHAASIDTSCFNASRICKLYGTLAAKGTATPERPHRYSRVVEVPGVLQVVGVEWLEALAAELPAEAPPAPTPPPAIPDRPEPDGGKGLVARAAVGPEVIDRARAYLATCAPAVSGSGGHNQTFKVCCKIGPGFNLTPEAAYKLLWEEYNPACVPPWSEKELRHKVEDAFEAETRRGWIAEAAEANGATPRGDEDGPAMRDATAADLRKLLTGDAWLYSGWIASAALNLLAAEGGTGKTRFCFDLHRRIYNGLPWPDGTPTPIFPADPKILYILADGQYQEVVDIATEFGIPDESIVINSYASDPFGGTSLETAAELADLEARIVRVGPVLVVIDTITNTGDFKSQDSSDAKRQYKPLQEIASRTRTPILCVTHLNAGGKVLGRRATEKVRVVIQMNCPDPEGQPNRRKLWVEKSKAMKPPALGITMGDEGNEYDTHPPMPPEDGRLNGATTGPIPLQTRKCIAWLAARLAGGRDRVSVIRRDAEAADFSPTLMYRAREALNLREEEIDGRKWWYPPGDPPEERVPDF